MEVDFDKGCVVVGYGWFGHKTAYTTTSILSTSRARSASRARQDQGFMSAAPFDFDTYKRNHAPSRSSIKKLDSALQMQHKFYMKTSAVHSRIEPETKKTAEGILRKLGLSPTDAIRLFYTQIALRNGLPFPVSIPNEETAQALEDSRKNKNLTTYATTDQLFESWDE